MIADAGAVHVCYCHNPFRYAWNEREATLAARGPLRRAALRLRLPALAPVGLDRRPARRPLRRRTPQTTRKRVARYFGREATVLHPPVEIGALRARARSGERLRRARPS